MNLSVPCRPLSQLLEPITWLVGNEKIQVLCPFFDKAGLLLGLAFRLFLGLERLIEARFCSALHRRSLPKTEATRIKQLRLGRGLNRLLF